MKDYLSMIPHQANENQGGYHKAHPTLFNISINDLDEKMESILMRLVDGVKMRTEKKNSQSVSLDPCTLHQQSRVSFA